MTNLSNFVIIELRYIEWAQKKAEEAGAKSYDK